MKRTTFKRIVTLVLAAAMCFSLAITALADDVTYQIQTAPMTVPDNLILCAAHAQADVTPEILGITNTTDRAGEVPAEYDLNKAKTSALMGNFGTDINESPNPYLYNWVYNSYATENGLPLVDKHTLGGISGHPNSVDNTVIDELGTSRSLYYRPDILVGTQVTGSGGKTYQDLIADLPENNDADPNNDYDPYNVTYLMSRSYDFLDTLNELAELCNTIKEDTGRVTRYGDPVTIAGDLAKYTKGFQAYILSKLEEEGKPQKVVAIVDPINSKEGVFYAVDENTSVQGTTTHSRAGEFMADTTVNIVDVLGKTAQSGTVGTTNDKTYYILTAEEIAQADLIVISGVQNQDGSEAAFREMLAQYIDPAKTDLQSKVETMPIMATRFKCAGSIGANSIENLLGMAYWTAFAYPEYANPVYVATYWYRHFYHITDNSSLQTIIAANFAGASIPDGFGYTTDLSGYSDAAVEAMIVAGMKYYESNQAKLSSLLLTKYGNNGGKKWQVDWESGIGAAQKPAEPVSAFTDLAKDAWYIAAATWASRGLIRGTSADKFSPDDTTTRAMMVQVLYRYDGEPYVANKATFSDVKDGDWYADAVAWAAANSITTGTSETTFSPDQEITRSEMATFLYRYAKYKGIDITENVSDISAATDYADVPDWARDAFAWAYGNEIIRGVSEEAFVLDPGGLSTRAQLATVLMKFDAIEIDA